MKLMMRTSHFLLVDFLVLLLIASSTTMEEGSFLHTTTEPDAANEGDVHVPDEGDVHVPDEGDVDVPDEGDVHVPDEGDVPTQDVVPHPELPDFEEGVTVNIVERMDSCARVALSGNWLELHFVAKQMSDDGETHEEFDSTQSRERPLFVAVDDREKLPGLTEGLRDVCVGEKREITIQAESPLMKVGTNSGLKQPKMDRPAVYEVTVRSILDQQPINLFAEMDLDKNNQLSREELKTYFENHGLGGMKEDDTLDQVIEGLMNSNDLDTDDHLSEAEFPKPYQHTEF